MGHLFVTVQVQPHEAFRQVDDDIHLDVALSLRQALLGGQLRIPTLKGGTEVLSVQASTQPGATKVIRGRGPPKLGGDGRGNMVLRFMLRLPKLLTKRQVELIEEFDTLAGSEPEPEPEPSRSSTSKRADPRRRTTRTAPVL